MMKSFHFCFFCLLILLELFYTFFFGVCNVGFRKTDESLLQESVSGKMEYLNCQLLKLMFLFFQAMLIGCV